MVSINDQPDIRRVFEGFHFETTEIRYTTTNQRQGRAEVTGELIVMDWEQEILGGGFLIRLNMAAAGEKMLCNVSN